MFKSLPLTYTCEHSIKVYEETQSFLEKNSYLNEIKRITWAYHAIGDVIPETNESFWSGHFFPWAESWEELQISLNFCFFGFYKQAMVSLRSALELGLLSVYWNLNDDGHLVIQNWLKAEQDTPKFSEIWKRLEMHQNFNAFQNIYDIKKRLLDMGFLHDYVHSKGHKFSNQFGLLKSNFQSFEEVGFKTWFEAFAETTQLLAILHLVKYPIGIVKYDFSNKFGIDKPMFGGLNPFQVERIEGLIGPEALAAINEIAKIDTNVIDIMTWIVNLPDMTDSQREEQIIAFDKLLIKQQGIEQWLENEKVLFEDAKVDHEEREKYKLRIEKLIQWAKENGFEKSKRERIIDQKENDDSSQDSE